MLFDNRTSLASGPHRRCEAGDEPRGVVARTSRLAASQNERDHESAPAGMSDEARFRFDHRVRRAAELQRDPPGTQTSRASSGGTPSEGSNGEQVAEAVRNGRSGTRGGRGKPPSVDPPTANVEEEQKPTRGDCTAGPPHRGAGPGRSPKETSIPRETPITHRLSGEVPRGGRRRRGPPAGQRERSRAGGRRPTSP